MPVRICARSVRASVARTTREAVGELAVVMVIVETNESPSIRPPPSHATPEKVSLVPSTPIWLDFEYTDSWMNSSDGVTDRQTPANASGDAPVDPTCEGFAEHPNNAHITADENQRAIAPPGCGTTDQLAKK